MASPDPTDAIASSLSGEQLAGLLRSSGPIVSCVLLQSKAINPSITENQSHNNGQSDDALEKKKESTIETKKTNNDEIDTVKREVLTELITEIQVDTTPKKSMVSEILGGKFTFLGQYEDEGIVVMIRREQGSEKQERPSDLIENPHKLQPPFHNTTVYGDILLMRVADGQDGCSSDSNEKGHCNAKGPETSDNAQSVDRTVNDEGTKDENTNAACLTNEEFFLNYTKEEYISFASRTDILPEESDEDNEARSDEEAGVDESESDDQIEEGGQDEGEEEDDDYSIGSDEDADSDEEDAIGMMNLLLGQILKRFQEENGRGPDTHELLSIRAALAQRLGIDSIPSVDDTNFSNSLQNGGDEEGKIEPSSQEDNNDDNSKERTCSTKEKRKASSDEKDDGIRKKVKFSNENQIKIIEGLNDSIDEDSLDEESIDEEEEEANATTCD